MNLDPAEGIAIFSDGSSYTKDRSGGWGAVLLDAFDGIHTLSGAYSDVTNNMMELAGPTHALIALSEAFGACDVLVYSDSQYVVLGATDRTRKRNKNKTWWKSLDKAIALHDTVEFLHVKGHNDHLYNEMADDLAGKARKEGQAK